MRKKFMNFSLFIATLTISITLFTACADDLNLGKEIDESAYTSIYENNAYLRDGKTNLASNLVELYQDKYITSVKLGLSKTPVTSTSAKVEVDLKYLESYNLEHGTDFEMYPLELISFANEGVLEINSNKKFAEVEMVIQTNDDLIADKTYAIPVAITEHSNDISVRNDKSKHCIYLVKDMRNAADTYKGENVVKGFLFIEVNDVNPLNTLSYELENGKLIWDVLVLFAANINYDLEADRPYIQCNPNVQYLLDNNETYLQPLRKRGVKVLLGLLGNHDIAGLAQLSDQGAKDFAREIAQYCKAYNLDGVNFDDEYSLWPDLSNPALTSKSPKAAARLCYETKKAIPDKLVTVFAYGSMYGVATVDEVDASEWIDIVVPNYGSRARPIGKMTYKQCAGLAAEFNLGSGGSLNPNEAQSLIRNDYGWHMGFAPYPHDFDYICNRLTGVEVLYNYKLKPKSEVFWYKKMIPLLIVLLLILLLNNI